MVTEHRLGDIIANSVTHGVGAAFALAGAVVLVVAAAGGTAWQVTSCSIFGCTLVLVYVCFTLYHSLVRTRANHVLRIIDHSAIYLLIAGTYTPFSLVSLRGHFGWLLFAIVWSLAILGIIFKSFAIERFAIASVVVYLGMGWLAVFAMRPLLHALTWHGIFWIALGGLFYTVGIVFYALHRLLLSCFSGISLCWPEAPVTTSRCCSMLPIRARDGRGEPRKFRPPIVISLSCT